MVAVGSLALRGTLDITDIERGYARIKAGFEIMKGHAKSVGSDMQRISQTVSGLSKKLRILGAAGVGTMIALAKSAPAVAPALAKMGISIFKLSNSLGRALAPAFERVSGLLERFATWVSANESQIGTLANRVIDVASALGNDLWPYLKAIGNFALEHPKLFIGLFAGLAFGPPIIAGIASVAGLAISLVKIAAVAKTLVLASGFLTAIGTTIVSSTLLTALSYLAAIAATGYAFSKMGTIAGEATYESRGETFVTSGIGSTIASTFAGIRDFFTGGTMQEDYLKALAASKMREDDRAYNLLNMDDRNIG